ncbi:MAG: hypothetical protein NT132_09650 [Microbacterium sp.]|nr:hypothetical protein [Microbacterium sp.]
MSLLMLAMGRASSVPLVAQIPLASGPRYASPPVTLIADAPSAGSISAAAGPAAAVGASAMATGSLNGAFSAHAVYPPGTPTTRASTTAVMIHPRLRRRRRRAGSRAARRLGISWPCRIHAENSATASASGTETTSTSSVGGSAAASASVAPGIWSEESSSVVIAAPTRHADPHHATCRRRSSRAPRYAGCVALRFEGLAVMTDDVALLADIADA